MTPQKLTLLGISFVALLQATPALATPTVITSAGSQINSGPPVIGTVENGPGWSYTRINGIESAPYSDASTSASSDVLYNSSSSTSVTNNAIASSVAQWFETIVNTTLDRRRFNFTFRIDGGTVAANALSTLQNGAATAGFEALFNLSRGGGAATNIFNVSRQVGITNTNSAEIFSDAATNNFSNVIGGGTLLDQSVDTGDDSISQSWVDSHFTLDLGELAPGESMTLSYLLRSFVNSSFTDEGCSTPDDEGFGLCQGAGARTGDPATLLGIDDPDIGIKSVLAATTSVPEPASMALLGFGLAGLGVARRSRRTICESRRF
jgi:PEP-CTERM motif